MESNITHVSGFCLCSMLCYIGSILFTACACVRACVRPSVRSRKLLSRNFMYEFLIKKSLVIFFFQIISPRLVELCPFD